MAAFIPRQFSRDDQNWTVERRTPSGRRHETGLQFVHKGEKRLLVFTLGALPSERELGTMSEEVLRVLLGRAESR